jgi:hypothetical protein
MKGHHGVLFTPSFGALSATAPRATKPTMMATSLRMTTTTMDHDGDSDGNGDGTMGSVATGYDNDGDDDGDVRDDNDATTTMATAHQAGYYAHLILNWKNMWQRRNGRRQRQQQHIL